MVQNMTVTILNPPERTPKEAWKYSQEIMKKLEKERNQLKEQYHLK